MTAWSSKDIRGIKSIPWIDNGLDGTCFEMTCVTSAGSETCCQRGHEGHLWLEPREVSLVGHVPPQCPHIKERRASECDLLLVCTLASTKKTPAPFPELLPRNRLTTGHASAPPLPLGRDREHARPLPPAIPPRQGHEAG